MDDTLRLAVLEKMGEQLTALIDTFAATRPPQMSQQTHIKTLGDMRAQLEVLQWAHSCCVLTMTNDDLNETDRVRRKDELQ